MDETTKSTPEFENILESLERSIDTLSEKSQLIKTKLSAIKSMEPEASLPDAPITQSNDTFIDRMKIKIDRLLTINQILEECVWHLESIVG